MTPPKDPVIDNKFICANCNGTQASNRCGGCKSVYYCNIKCQKAHWKQHKVLCKKQKKINQKGMPLQIFTDYLLKEYPNYLDDIMHINVIHEYDLEEIYDLLLLNSEYESL